VEVHACLKRTGSLKDFRHSQPLERNFSMSEALNSLKVAQTRFDQADDRMFANSNTGGHFAHAHPRLAEAVKWRGGV